MRLIRTTRQGKGLYQEIIPARKARCARCRGIGHHGQKHVVYAFHLRSSADWSGVRLSGLYCSLKCFDLTLPGHAALGTPEPPKPEAAPPDLSGLHPQLLGYEGQRVGIRHTNGSLQTAYVLRINKKKPRHQLAASPTSKCRTTIYLGAKFEDIWLIEPLP